MSWLWQKTHHRMCNHTSCELFCHQVTSKRHWNQIDQLYAQKIEGSTRNWRGLRSLYFGHFIEAIPKVTSAVNAHSNLGLGFLWTQGKTSSVKRSHNRAPRRRPLNQWESSRLSGTLPWNSRPWSYYFFRWAWWRFSAIAIVIFSKLIILSCL